MKLSINPISQSSGGSTKLGNSNYTITSHGCYLVCLYMSFKHWGRGFGDLKTINQDFKINNCFNGALIVGDSVATAYDLKFEWVASGDFEKIIKDRLDQNLPTIIRISKFEHFVLAIGYDDNGKIFINDPLRGETYYLMATGYGIKSLRLYTPNKPMTNETDLQACLKTHASLMSQLEEKGKEMERLEKRLITSEEVRKSLGDQVEVFIKEIEEMKKLDGNCQKELKTATSQIKNLTEEREIIMKERNEFKKWYNNALSNDIAKKSIKELVTEIIRKFMKVVKCGKK